ncbi:alpha-ketoglutarate dehydrogenase [Saccharomycopsis crataegensis]|uniref:2-oxoglutarate dehydrogenase, mitochondrial n=1 Tax=Saccharomycopsis crataegensis TaxID=43959 RepID=A0AAV5QVJ2_9ASCO|nr:alpha-ketoglutarate dehydrogenase [Saccharomycopsis crataegensis]
MLRALQCTSANSRAILTARRAVNRPVLATTSRLLATSTDTFSSTNNAAYIDEMYSSWKQDPSSVHVSWQAYFRNLDNGAIPASQAFTAPPSIVSNGIDQGIPTMTADGASSTINTHLKVQLLVRAYQVRGHRMSKLDPLGISFGDDASKPAPKELTPEYYGFTEADLEQTITLGPGILNNFVQNHGIKSLKLKEIIAHLKGVYAGHFGVEYTHIPSREKCNWIREHLENPTVFKYTPEKKKQILDRLIWATSFETFLSTKFPNDKRFGLEGAESLIPGFKAIIDRSVELGVEDVIIGMAHRGRLNMLSNVVRKPNESIFSEFTGSKVNDVGSGDVKYHLGMNYKRPTVSGKHVNLSLVANPSHLEAEDPVVLGRTRAVQHLKNDVGTFDKALGILVHGDAAFAGQGVVYETTGLSSLPAYTTGGSIHVIVNNQIGFTTDPRNARSTTYPSDIAKAINAPIFHVNADDVEAVIFVSNLAAEWRAKWHSDVIIDLIGYRKHGHNETDQPSFTQPLMYKKVGEKQSVIDIYIAKLIEEGSLTKEDIAEHKKWVWDLLEESFAKSKDYKPTTREWLTTPWEGFKSPKELATEVLPHLPTALEGDLLKDIGVKSSTPPKENFEVHRNLKRILNNRIKSLDKGEGIDWATGEALAFGSLVNEGYHVRVSGQDVERGTFSQRHAVLHDQNSEDTYTPLKHISEKQGDFVINNSSLSEYGVMGFEYGYSLTSPDALVMWEAQFGDFANTAQVIIDQFIYSGETKWKQRSGLVLSLPHGYDGQGPEHSSARIERYLQLVNDDPRHFPTPEKLQRQHQDCNVQVTYPTTPANYFHLLRRQMHRQFRKPLTVFFSKSLLRHPLARSNMEEFTGESHFQWIIDDVELGKSINEKAGIKRLVLCSGQVYVNLFKKRQTLEDKETAFVKIEQLHPFPYEQLRDLFDSYPNLQDLVWCQEEAFNYGPWSFVQPRLQTTLKETKQYADKEIRYAGRDPSASIATGIKATHIAEEEQFLSDVFGK